jgi:hypothetical protein
MHSIVYQMQIMPIDVKAAAAAGVTRNDGAVEAHGRKSFEDLVGITLQAVLTFPDRGRNGMER